MKIYSWEHRYKNGAEVETILHSIVIRHIVSLYVARCGYGDDAMPFALHIQTKERCWERRFATFSEAVAEYEELNMEIRCE